MAERLTDQQLDKLISEVTRRGNLVWEGIGKGEDIEFNRTLMELGMDNAFLTGLICGIKIATRLKRPVFYSSSGYLYDLSHCLEEPLTKKAARDFEAFMHGGRLG